MLRQPLHKRGLPPQRRWPQPQDCRQYTAGGVLGKVTEVHEQFVHIQVADGVVLKVQRHTVGAVMPKGTVKSA